MMGSFTASAVMALSDRISGPLQRIYEKMGQVERQAGRLASASAALTKKLLPMATAAALVLGAFTATVLSTVETQKALGELGSVGITEFGAMERAAEDFSNKFSGTTKSDFLYAAYDIKSGISSLSDEGVAGMTGLAALTAKATKASVAEMTSLFATGYGIYKGYYKKMSDLEFGEMFSAGIAASVQAFKTDGSKMSQAISTLGATATNANVPLEEQLAILGTLQATMPGAEAGTKYKAFLNAAAAGGRKLGLNFMDANGQLLSTPAIMDKLRGKFGPTINAMEKMKIKEAFGTDEAVAFIDLLYTKTGDLAAGISQVAGAMGQGQSFTLKMARSMNADLGASMAVAGQQFHNLTEIVGSTFAPAMTGGFNALSPLLLGLQKLAGSTAGKVLLWTAAGAAALLVAVTALAAGTWAVLAGFAFVKAQLIVFAGATKIATAAQWLFNAAFSATPIGWVVLGLAAVAAGLWALYTYCEPVRNALSSLWGWIKGLFDIDLTESGRKLMSTFMDGIRSLINAPVELVTQGLQAVRALLPFSDAQEGPLSTLTLSGARMMQTLGAGIRSAAPALATTAAQALGGVALAATVAVPPALAQPSAVPAPAQFSPASTSGEDAATPARGRSVTIHIGQIQLPGVKDAGDFLEELRRLVEAHDGQ